MLMQLLLWLLLELFGKKNNILVLLAPETYHFLQKIGKDC